MKSDNSLDMLLRSLHLPSILRENKSIAQTAEDQGWSFTKYLHSLVQLEMMERSQRRVQRNLKKSNLPDGKTMDTLDQNELPVKIRKQIPMLLEGGFVERAENILAFGLPGRGKSHLLCAIARELIIHKDLRVQYFPTFKLVQQLLIAKKDLTLEALLKKLDRLDVILLDDIGYVQQNREEMEVLFTFLSERYERRSLMITSNLVFSEWDKIFKNPMTTAAAIDRLVHHSIIMELNCDSYRSKHARSKLQDNSLSNKDNQKGKKKK
jgi:DNA replication protein DnaC